MKKTEFEKIIADGGFADLFTVDNWNEGYSVPLNFTVKDLRDIHKTLSSIDHAFQLGREEGIEEERKRLSEIVIKGVNQLSPNDNYKIITKRELWEKVLPELSTPTGEKEEKKKEINAEFDKHAHLFQMDEQKIDPEEVLWKKYAYPVELSGERFITESLFHQMFVNGEIILKSQFEAEKNQLEAIGYSVNTDNCLTVCDSGYCITPCPHNMDTAGIKIHVGSGGCNACEHFISGDKNMKIVICAFNWHGRNKKEETCVWEPSKDVSAYKTACGAEFIVEFEMPEICPACTKPIEIKGKGDKQ